MTDEFKSLDQSLSAVTDTSPLIVSYTNDVTIDAVANTTLHWGGLPVMSTDHREADAMLGIAGGCLINMGTVNADTEELMSTAGQSAVEQGIPVVFDPVGAGATPTRTQVAERLIEDAAPSVIKGNYGEITALTGNDADVRGVESVGEYADIAKTAIACARKTDAVIVASGETDIVATDDRAYELTAGDPMMGQFVGSGCMLGGTLATFVGGASNATVLDAAVAGTIAFGLAGENAASSGNWNGPASYKQSFLDAVAAVEPNDLAEIDLADRTELIAET